MNSKHLKDLHVDDGHVIAIYEDQGDVEVWLTTEDGGCAGLIVGMAKVDDPGAALREAAATLHAAARAIEGELVATGWSTE